MLSLVLQSADDLTQKLEFRVLTARLDDGRTWTFKPIAWRWPNGAWVKLGNIERPLTIAEIKEIETTTGWKMIELGTKISTDDWVYTFQKAI